MLYILLLFINFFQTPQESKVRTFELINTESGLSNNIIYDIYQDKEGFIWMATDNGLNRYDGYSFKKFYHNPLDSTSLSSNIIRKVLEDKEGNLWIGSKNGFNLYNRKDESFQRYYINKKSEFPSESSIIDTQQILLDKNGKIWVNDLKELGYFDTQTKQSAILKTNFYTHSITMQKDGILWVNSKEGRVGYVDVDSLKLVKLVDKKTVFEQQIHYGKYSNSLWLPERLSNQISDVPTRVIPKLPNNIAPVRLKEINEQILLIGSDDGLYEYNYQDKMLRKVNLSNSLSTLTRQIRSIYKDKNNGLWIGTLGGVFHYDDYKNNFEHIDLNRNEVDVVMGLQAVHDGIFANTLGKGLYFKSHNSPQFKKIDTRNIIEGQELFIWGIKEVPESDYPIWLSTNVGLICYNPKNNKKRKIKLPVIHAGIEISFDIYNTNASYVWVASMGSVHKVDKKTSKKLASYLLNEGKNRSTVQKVIEFDESLILATESDGLFRLNTATGKTSYLRLKENSNKEASIFKTYLWDLHTFQNTLWIGTNRGLFKLDKGETLATPVFSNNQIIFSIEDDGKGVLWLGTERGLTSYNIQEDKIHHYGKVDGLKNIEYNRRSVTKTKDGKLWFGGVNGITFFDPSQIQTNPVKPEVYVTQLNVIVPDSTLRIPHEEKKVALPHYHNTIELDYVALNYTNSSQNLYKHQMIGRDPNWVSSQSRKARYVRLPTGNYTFHVIGSNNDGLWNEVGNKIEIEILPPYWETWWFRSLAILLLLALMFAIYKYRVNRLLEIERMKLRIASDLHDEVGSGLSGIALTSDILEQQVHHGELKPHLVSRITRNARNLASTLDDIVWLINPEKETLGDYIIKTKTIAQELLPNTQLSFQEEISEQIKGKILPSELKRNLLLLVKEVVNNIAKHAQSNATIIRYQITDKVLQLTIKDDGKGFDINKETSGNGLLSIKNRAKEINGNLTIVSEVNKGTSITISVKIP